MLRIECLSKHFGTTVAVNDVSVHIPAGQMVGVIGRSGAGKSTLLRLLNRLIEPSQGSIYHHDVPSLPCRVASCGPGARVAR